MPPIFDRKSAPCQKGQPWGFGRSRTEWIRSCPEIAVCPSSVAGRPGWKWNTWEANLGTLIHGRSGGKSYKLPQNYFNKQYFHKMKNNPLKIKSVLHRKWFHHSPGTKRSIPPTFAECFCSVRTDLTLSPAEGTFEPMFGEAGCGSCGQWVSLKATPEVHRCFRYQSWFLQTQHLGHHHLCQQPSVVLKHGLCG